MNLEIRRIKNTPYKVVLSGKNLIGIFDHGQYIKKDLINDKLKRFVNEHELESDDGR